MSLKVIFFILFSMYPPIIFATGHDSDSDSKLLKKSNTSTKRSSVRVIGENTHIIEFNFICGWMH
jgi:hypothetical protein